MKQRTASGKGGVPSLRNPIPLPQNLPTTMVGFACAAEKRGGGEVPFVPRAIFCAVRTHKKGKFPLMCVSTAPKRFKGMVGFLRIGREKSPSDSFAVGFLPFPVLKLFFGSFLSIQK